MSFLEKVKNAGVIGAGGAGFPTYAKLTSKAEYIILNGAECEPLLRVDQQLMELYPEEIIRGFNEARKEVSAEKGIIGIKKKHTEVIKILRATISKLQLSTVIEINGMEDIYPAGDEQVLVYETTKRVVPEGGIPLQVGCVVINSETALNIYNATLEKPVIYKYITITGDIKNKITVKVPVGTKIIELLKLSGIENFEEYKVIDGGPMMGTVMNNLNGYVTKKNKGFIILKKDHPLIIKKSVVPDQARRVNRASCEQCRMCTDMCPRYLLGHKTQPHKMMRALGYKIDNLKEVEISQLCCECNLCELFICPVGLYPRNANTHFKRKLMEEKIRYKCENLEFKSRDFRDYRMVQSKKLILKLGLKKFDDEAPLTEISFNPNIVSIATNQHIGAPAIPVIKVGDYVQVGQVIGDVSLGKLGATIHASISGTVIEVEKDYIKIRRG